MKWGVRRYQNKDGTLTSEGKDYYKKAGATVINPGKHYNHISDVQKIKLRDNHRDVRLHGFVPGTPIPIITAKKKKDVLYTYDKGNKHDADVYEGAYAKYLNMKVFNGVFAVDKYKHEYVNSIPVISPSKQERIDTFVETFNKNNRLYSKVILSNDNQLMKGYNADPEYYKSLFKSNYTGLSKAALKNPDTIKANSDKLYNSYLQSQGHTTNIENKATSKYLKSLSDKGYNALVDDNNKKIYNDAESPMIFINPKRMLKEIGVSKVSVEEQERRVDNLRKTLEKRYGKGTPVKL